MTTMLKLPSQYSSINIAMLCFLTWLTTEKSVNDFWLGFEDVSLDLKISSGRSQYTISVDKVPVILDSVGLLAPFGLHT